VTPLRWFRCAVALALVAGVSAVVPGAEAQQDPDPKSEDQLKTAIGEASQAEIALLTEVHDVQARRSVLEARARELDAKVADATARQREAAAAVARIDAELVPLLREVARFEGEIAESRDDFGNAAAALYRNASGRDILPSFSYNDGDATSVVEGDRYLRQISQDAQADADRLDELKDDVEAAKEALEEQRRLADAARAAVEAERAEVERLRAEAEPARAAAETEEAHEAQLLDEVQARKAEFEGQLASLQAEQAALAQNVSRGGGGGGGGSGNGRFIWPCNGPMVSGFGSRVHPISGTRKLHTGVDIGCGYGAPIVAGGSGVVIEAGWRGGYGNAVLVDHGDGLATLYAHQSSMAASPGQSVATGEVIGYVGSTGYSTGPHLHWEVWVNGTPVNPMGYA
jgi:murein DD-endopeptidase MepM/ murein hydrolase activator NlpD